MAILRSCVKALVLCSLALQLPAHGQAQKYPTKTVRYVVPDSPGSGGDVFGRIVAAGLSEVFGHQVIVDNRVGAASNIGAEIVSKSAPDGYTLLAVSSTLSANIHLYRSLGYDLVRDLAPVTQMGFTPFVLVVNPSFPAKTVADLIKLAKDKPGAINYASAGTGAATFIAGEMFKGVVGVNIVHVPYKGGGPALLAVLSGEAPVYFAPLITAIGHIKQGAVRALATMSAQRFPLLPALPTLAEAGVRGSEFSNSFGMAVPAKTPPEIIAAINRAVVTVLGRPDVVKRIQELGCIVVGSPSKEYAAFIKKEIATFAEMFNRLGVKAE